MSALVLDASALVALLIDGGALGDWVSSEISGAYLAAPDLVLPETANVLRRYERSRRLERVEASLAHEQLLLLPLKLWPYETVAQRAWELRNTITSYDASYVAVAELMDADLVTLDERLARASGPRCGMRTPPQIG